MVIKLLRGLTDPNPAGEFLGDMRVFGGKGGGKAPKAPKAPDPEETAKAQGKMSKDVALWNSALQNVNQITPFGNLTWSLGGTSGNTGGGQQTNTQGTTTAGAGMYVGPDGKVYDTSSANWKNTYLNNNPIQGSAGGPEWVQNSIRMKQLDDLTAAGFKPLSGSNSSSNSSSTGGYNSNGLPQWTSEVQLSPESQAIFDSYMRQQNQLGGLSESALNQVAQAYGSPYNYDSLNPLYGADDLNAARQRTEEALYSRLNPQFAQDEEALRTRLINQGIGQGSQAYQREMENFNQMKNDARMQAVLAGGTEADRLFAQSLAARQQGIGEIDKLRAQPLNEYLAMSGQQQLAMPQFQQYGYQGAGTPDYQGLVNQKYQADMANYNAKQASSNNMMGSLFGLGGQALGGFLGSPAGSAAVAGLFSDERLKENIKHIGEENGFPIYEFNYINVPDKRFIGVMAQDIEKVMPEAVGESEGYKTVNYGMIGVEMREVA